MHNCLLPTPTERDRMGSLSPHFQGPLPSSLGPLPLCWVGESRGSNAYTHLHFEWDTQMFNAEIPIIVFGVESPKVVQYPEHNKNFRTDVDSAIANSIFKSLFSQRHWFIRKKNVETLKSLTTQSHDFVHSPPKLLFMSWPISLSYGVLYPMSLLTQSGCYPNALLWRQHE